jgi:hypothetical protein
MKKFAFIFGILLVGAILVATGYWLGFGQRFVTDAYSVSVVDQSLANASAHAMLLHELDSGHTNSVRNLLRIELDGDILTIWSLVILG